MRVGILMGWVLLVVPVARCGGVIEGGSDSGSDGPVTNGTCSSSSDCPSGSSCFFPTSGGCSSIGKCFSGYPPCKGSPACACNGQTQFILGCGPPGYASAPIQYQGMCAIGPPPCGSALACELCDVSGYSPTNLAKPAAQVGACTPSEIADFTNACISPNATQQTCSAWQQKEADAGACLPCIFTLQSSATWGALVCTNSSCMFNTAGCVDLELGATAQEKAAGGPGSCGDLLSDEYGCIDYACGTCDTTGSPNSDYDTCSKNATTLECANFANAASSGSGACAVLNADAGPAGLANCFVQSPVDAPNFFNVFCGTGP